MEVEKLANLGKLEIEKKQKKEEMESLIEEMQTALRSTGPSKPSGNMDVEQQQALIQVINEMQAEMKQKRALIEVTLRELHEGMNTVKKLRAEGNEGKEDEKARIMVMQEEMNERKVTLVEAVQEMELLQKKYVQLMNG